MSEYIRLQRALKLQQALGTAISRMGKYWSYRTDAKVMFRVIDDWNNNRATAPSLSGQFLSFIDTYEHNHPAIKALDVISRFDSELFGQVNPKSGLAEELYAKSIPIISNKAAAIIEKANLGDANAMCDLAMLHYKGEEGYTQNYNTAFIWWRMAANLGLARGQFNLGLCYYNGDGVQKDFSQAVFFYERAAAQGLAAAQCNLGLCYYNGEGVPQSNLTAKQLWGRAAAQGNEDARRNLRGVFGGSSW